MYVISLFVSDFLIFYKSSAARWPEDGSFDLVLFYSKFISLLFHYIVSKIKILITKTIKLKKEETFVALTNELK